MYHPATLWVYEYVVVTFLLFSVFFISRHSSCPVHISVPHFYHPLLLGECKPHFLTPQHFSQYLLAQSPHCLFVSPIFPIRIVTFSPLEYSYYLTLNSAFSLVSSSNVFHFSKSSCLLSQDLLNSTQQAHG